LNIFLRQYRHLSCDALFYIFFSGQASLSGCMQTALSSQSDFFEAFRTRGLAVLSDDAGETERSILLAPAQELNRNLLNEALTATAGLCFVALSPERVSSFMLLPMSQPRQANRDFPGDDDLLRLCVSVEAREGVSTGISVDDRTATIRILGEPEPNPRKLIRPGHVFPVETRKGGVLVRNSLPEGALDLVRIAGFTEAALFLDLLDESGEYLSSEGTQRLCRDRQLPQITLSRLVRHRLATEKLVTRIAEAALPSRFAGGLRSCIYKSQIHSGEHLALIKGRIEPGKPVLTRIQAEHTCSDVFDVKEEPFRAQLRNSLREIERNGSGVLIYLRRPRQGDLKLQIENGSARTEPKLSALMREYGLGAQILHDLGVSKVELLSNSPHTLLGLSSFQIEIVSQRPVPGFEGVSHD